MINLEEIAASANMIVNGYAFTKAECGIRILNLNNPSKATLLSEKGEVLETTMDDIEIDIIQDYYHRNQRFMTI